MSAAFKTTAAVVLGVAVFAGCKPADSATGGVQSGGDVVIATGMSRSGDEETHYAECAADPNARLGDYQVVIPPELDYGGLPAGSPCPYRPREPNPHDEYPELYAELSEAIHAPLPYEGGDLETCGEWGTDDPADARRMAAECPPLTKGNLE